jgi:hypothetical protein
MTAHAATAIFAGLSVKRSSNSQTLRAMPGERVDDDQSRLRHAQRPDAQSGLLEQRTGYGSGSNRVHTRSGRSPASVTPGAGHAATA